VALLQSVHFTVQVARLLYTPTGRLDIKEYYTERFYRLPARCRADDIMLHSDQ